MTEPSGRNWQYRRCPDCGELTSLLLDDGAARATCLACWQAVTGVAPRRGDVTWTGAPSAMVDYWLEDMGR